MKAGFDFRAVSYFLLLFGGIFLLTMNLDGAALSRYLLPGALILLGLSIGFNMFQIPLCMKLGWYARGERLLLAVLHRAGDSPNAVPFLFHLFLFQFQQGKLAEATATLDRLAAAELPEEARPAVAHNRAGVLAADEKYREALDIYLRYSVEDFPSRQQPVFLNNLAFAYAALGIELANGLDIADRAFNMAPDPRFAKTLAWLLLRQGETDAARAWCDYGLKRLPRADRISRAWCWYLRAQVCRATGDKLGAGDAARHGLALSPLDKLSRRLEKIVLSH